MTEATTTLTRTAFPTVFPQSWSGIGTPAVNNRGGGTARCQRFVLETATWCFIAALCANRLMPLRQCTGGQTETRERTTWESLRLCSIQPRTDEGTAQDAESGFVPKGRGSRASSLAPRAQSPAAVVKRSSADSLAAIPNEPVSQPSSESLRAGAVAKNQYPKDGRPSRNRSGQSLVRNRRGPSRA
jgi:hypothetical protein